MRVRRAIVNGLVLLVSLMIGLLLCEVGVRLVVNPGDYLSARTVADETLGIRVTPGTAGFDEWGFRNKKVPSRAEIVAIGDSHTYGNNAAMADSWPYVTARLTGRSVYNLGLGGYGPNQYYYLLKTLAVKLKPRWVVCALYLGDDFENAFLMTYGREYWSFLRKGHWAGVEADIWKTPDGGNWHRTMRVWLSENSVIYRLLVHGSVFGELKGASQIRQAAQGEDRTTTSLIVPESGIQEAFRPVSIRDRLDERISAVREGMRITMQLLSLMDKTCRENGCQLVVVLIPTKETVFADYLLRAPQLHLREVVAELIIHEEKARKRLGDFLTQAGIPYVDTLPALRREVAGRLYTRSDRDMHPGRNGYKVIGEAVAKFFRS